MLPGDRSAIAKNRAVSPLPIGPSSSYPEASLGERKKERCDRTATERLSLADFVFSETSDPSVPPEATLQCPAKRAQQHEGLDPARRYSLFTRGASRARPDRSHAPPNLSHPRGHSRPFKGFSASL